MKRILNFILLALSVIAYTSCDNDEGIEYIQKSSVKIVSRDVNFPAGASQGSIVVEAPSDFTVSTSDKGWCTTTISGSTIQVNVEQNLALEGRSSMVTIRCGADTACVAVVQAGVIFELSSGSAIGVGNETATYSYDVKCNTELTISTFEDWITANYDPEEGKLNISVQENKTGHIRRGNISYTAGTYKDVIKVTQCNFGTDLAGEYLLFFINPSNGKTQYLNATLAKTGNAYSILLPDLELAIPVAYKETGQLILKAGQYIGDYGPYKIHTLFWDTNAGYITWDPSVSMTAAFEYIVEKGVGYTLAPFEDDGSWGTYLSNAICLEAYTSTNISPDTDEGSLIDMVAPSLQRAHSEEAISFVKANKAEKAYIKLSSK